MEASCSISLCLLSGMFDLISSIQHRILLPLCRYWNFIQKIFPCCPWVLWNCTHHWTESTCKQVKIIKFFWNWSIYKPIHSWNILTGLDLISWCLTSLNRLNGMTFNLIVFLTIWRFEVHCLLKWTDFLLTVGYLWR